MPLIRTSSWRASDLNWHQESRSMLRPSHMVLGFSHKFQIGLFPVKIAVLALLLEIVRLEFFVDGSLSFMPYSRACSDQRASIWLRSLWGARWSPWRTDRPPSKRSWYTINRRSRFVVYIGSLTHP